jgi:hypothetical protein
VPRLSCTQTIVSAKCLFHSAAHACTTELDLSKHRERLERPPSSERSHHTEPANGTIISTSRDRQIHYTIYPMNSIVQLYRLHSHANKCGLPWAKRVAQDLGWLARSPCACMCRQVWPRWELEVHEVSGCSATGCCDGLVVLRLMMMTLCTWTAGRRGCGLLHLRVTVCACIRCMCLARVLIAVCLLPPHATSGPDLLHPSPRSLRSAHVVVVMGANQSLLSLSNSVQALAYKQYTAADHSFWNDVRPHSRHSIWQSGAALPICRRASAAVCELTKSLDA